MKLSIKHETSYAYDEPVGYALQQLRLKPKNRVGQEVLEWNVTIEGGKTELEFSDHHNNYVTLVSANADETRIHVTASGIIDTNDTSGIIGKHGGYLPIWYFKRSTELTKPGKNIASLVRQFREPASDDISRLHNLSSEIAGLIRYETGTTHANTTAEQAISNQSGVCQDHTHVFLAAARSLGFPARYVSGYLMLNDRVEQDASHAWAEVYLENIGWVGFDISNGISPDERYVPVATGLDYLETAPISGMRFGNSSESMIVSLQVQQ